MRINGFEQIKGFYSWVFSNQELNIKPQHISLYLFLVNQNNRNNWAEWFKVPFDLAMSGSCISSKKTYYNCLEDLKVWGLISYEKGVNTYRSAVVKLEVLKDTSSVPQSEPLLVPQCIPVVEPQHEQQLEPLLEPQGTHNIKPLTINLKQVTGNKKENFPPSEIDFELTKKIMDWFGFTETANFDKMRQVSDFQKCLTVQDKIEYFKTQFSAYKEFKALDPRFKHSFDNFLGDKKMLYVDGKWNAENWIEKLKSEKINIKGPGPAKPGKAEAVMQAQSKIKEFWNQQAENHESGI